MKETIRLVKIENADEKANIVSEVLEDLADWFGIPEATKAYIDAARELPLWAARNGKELIGFITLNESNPETGEIHCMGVKRAYHRKGIGKLLFDALEEYARGSYKFLQVKTVEEGHYEAYDKTVAFYKALGFSKLEVFPSLWDIENPCLIMIKAL